MRTGKSTFIQQFMEKLVLPGIENAHIRARALDELPQSGSGRTIMTTKPAFVPNEAVELTLPENNRVRLRLIDSVGYMIDGALGTQEGDAQRMVKTPWADEEIPFERAAEIGTQRVIGEHSTIGLVVTTDGSVTELPRSSYVPAEARAVEELKALGKPFAVILNTDSPSQPRAQSLRKNLEQDYGVPVIAMNVAQMEEADIQQVLEGVLGQFPVVSMSIQTPEWLGALEQDHWLIKSLMDSLQSGAPQSLRIGDVQSFAKVLEQNPYR